MLLTEEKTPKHLEDPVKHLFFTGKGGVGKTSVSVASAIFLAEKGKKVLIVSTDPASNLDQVLEKELGSAPVKVKGVPGLDAMNIDPRKSAEAYREKVTAPYKGVLPDAAVREIEERLSGACTVEIAAFDEFSKLMSDNVLSSVYDHIVFDTAPTGHTLRLLKLPAAWTDYMGEGSGSASCLGPMSGLQGQKAQFEETLSSLNDAKRTRLVLVTRPEKHSIMEADRTMSELRELDIKNMCLVINGVLENNKKYDDISENIKFEQDSALSQMPQSLKKLCSYTVPLSALDLIGVEQMRRMFYPLKDHAVGKGSQNYDIKDYADELKKFILDMDIKKGIIMTMGKGGVGKTTIATSIALDFVSRGIKVHLTTSDPAAHLDQNISGGLLKVSRIDPEPETKKYTEEVMRQSGSSLDEEGRKLLEEDLKSPCTEEIAVFRAFAKIVDEAKDGIVVLDTAPTGHTLLLLDATAAYNKEISRNNVSMPSEVTELMGRLRNKDHTKIMVVTLPEATPIQEASDLQDDLMRAGIEPYAWIVNRVLGSLEVSHPVLSSKKNSEKEKIRLITGKSKKIAYVPFLGNKISVMEDKHG